jgi:hypothetical protein
MGEKNLRYIFIEAGKIIETHEYVIRQFVHQLKIARNHHANPSAATLAVGGENVLAMFVFKARTREKKSERIQKKDQN